MKWSHEMAHTKPRPAAAHPAQDPALAPGAAPAPGSPAAAVHAALAASPGATIADAAGTGKPAARTALLAMEAAGTATRVKGSKPGIPDTWTLAEPAPERTGPALDPEGEQAGQPVDGPGGSLDGAGEDETAGSTGQERTAGTDDPAPEDGGNAEGGTSAAPGPETEQPKSHDDAPADGDPEDAAQADASGEAGDAPDPALVTDLTERITQIKATADAAAGVVDGGGDLRAALAGLDEIYEQAAQARRSLKAALGGRKTPAARPGGLRDKVLAHLDDHPDGAFTPHEIHKVLGNSSGAIANALDTLVKLGEADLATDC
jgi:hypothetical protein